MRKFIIAGMAVAMLAVPSVASASVNVNDGVGTVAKGDVQTALKWNNGDFDKSAASISFTGGVTRVTDNYWGCTDELHAARRPHGRHGPDVQGHAGAEQQRQADHRLEPDRRDPPNTVISDSGVPNPFAADGPRWLDVRFQQAVLAEQHRGASTLSRA